nr:hypothetical protein [Tanacetum cinerariifolium]
MFEREKLSGNNFNDWFRQLKLVLRVEKKMFVTEQPIPPAPGADFVANVLAEWNALYDAHNEVACLMLGSMTPELHRQFENYSPYEMLQELRSMFEKQARVERFNPIQTFHACKQEEDKSVVAYVLQMKGYVDQLKHTDERIWFREARKLKQRALYLYVGIRAQVEAIGGFDLVLPNGLVICLDNCHYAPFITRGVVSVHHLVENGFIQCFTNFGILVSKNNVFYFNAIPSNGIYEIDIHDLVPNVNSIYNVSTKRAKHNLDSTYLWLCHLAYISKKHIEKLQQEWIFKSTYDESFDQCVSCLSGKMTRKSFPHRPERATDLLGIIHTDVCGPLRHVPSQGASYFITFIDDYSHYGYVYLYRGGEYISQEFKYYLNACGIVQQLTPSYTPQHNGVSGSRNRTLLDMVQSMMSRTTLSLSFWDYDLESSTRILNMVLTKKVDKIPYELWYAKFFEKNLITQEVSRRAIDLEEIQDEDTSPFKITSKIPIEVEGFEPPQEEVILIHRSERTHRTPTHLCLNVEVEEHSLWDLNEPTSYKAAMLDSESNKWIDAMNVEIQSKMDKMVWVLVDLPPGCKTVRSKCIFKKKTNMDGIVHTYKARLVAQGYTQLYGVNYEETFSPVADIRAIRILISITALYDYEIWQMDVKTAFLNGYLDEDMYMVQPEGFVNLNHPKKVC